MRPAKPALPTVVPTVTPIADWHMLENAGFQIWLPASYLGGTNRTIDAVVPQLAQKDASFANIAQSLKLRGTPFLIFAVDTDSKPGKVTYMLVANERLSRPIDMPGYLDLIAGNLTAQSNLFQILQKQVLPSDRYPTDKIVVEINTLESGDIKQVVYALKNGGAMWQISFTTPVEEFDARSPVFEQIAKSANLPYIAEPANPGIQFTPWILGLSGAALVVIAILAVVLIKQRQKAAPLPSKRTVKKKNAKNGAELGCCLPNLSP